MTGSYVWHESFICWTWLNDVTHWFICVTWLFHMLGMTHVTHMSQYVWHESFICWTWLIAMCNMTHSYVGHDLYATWLIHVCDMTYMQHDSFICVTWCYVQYDSFICVTWLIHMCTMTYSYVQHDSFICAPWLIYMRGHDSCDEITSVLIPICRNPVGHVVFVSAAWLKHMGWLHVVDFIKL